MLNIILHQILKMNKIVKWTYNKNKINCKINKKCNLNLLEKTLF